MNLTAGLVVPCDPIGEDRNQIWILLHRLDMAKQIIDDEAVVIGQIKHELALGLVEDIEPIGRAASILREPKGADREIALAVRFDHALRVVSRSVVRNHDLEGFPASLK